MPVPYSEDLRRKVIQACERGTESQRAIAALFSVSQSFVESVWHHYRYSGGEFVPHRRCAGRHARLDEACHERLRSWLDKQPDLTLQELIDRLQAATAIAVSEPTMCRVLQQLGMCRKKTIHATERDSARVRLARRRYRRQIARFAVKKLKFVDESGLNIAMTRRYGRAAAGQRVHDAVPKNFGRNVTILGALSCCGLDAVMTVDGATDAEVFRAYVSQVLAPTLRPGDVAVMDNLSAYKAAGIETAIVSIGAKLVYLPPYSPDWSPIEPCWSAIKTRLRGIKARTRDVLDCSLAKIVNAISNRDARGWFTHCGYAFH